MVSVKTLILLITLIQINISVCFMWDEVNIERLFNNREQILDEIINQVKPEEKLCINQFKYFTDQLVVAEPWAVKFLDTWGKEPAGLLSGNNVDFGHYDQCISIYHSNTPPEVGTINGMYCKIPVSEANSIRNATFDMFICMPRSCNEKLTETVINAFFANVDSTVNENTSCMDGSKPKFEKVEWVTTGIFIALSVLLILSTLYDWIKKYRDEKPSNILSSFSLYENADKLFYRKYEKETIECINGIRVLSMAWIVMLNCFAVIQYIPAIYNRYEMQQFKTTFGYTFNFHGNVNSDTFLLVSGLLNSYSFMKAREKREGFNIIKYYLHRYLRLMPVFGALILIVISYFKYFGDGPLYGSIVNDALEKDCRTYWWTALLCIQNYYNPLNQCISPSWYISMDMQLFLISPLFLFPLRKYGYRFLPFMVIVALISCANVFRLVLMNRYTFVDKLNWAENVYYPTHNRISVWLIGIALGYILFSSRYNRAHIPKLFRLVLWILSFGIMITTIVSPYPFYATESADIIYFAFYETLHRILWGLSVSWIIYACCNGHGGIVNWILSFPIYQTLAKLTFSIFLLHYPMLILMKATIRVPEYWTPFQMFNYFLAVWGLCILLAIPCYLMFETPIPNAETSAYKIWNHKIEEENFKPKNLFRIPRVPKYTMKIAF